MPIETPQGMMLAGSTQQLGERDSLYLCLEIPDRVFERSLGHAVAANLPEDVRTSAAAFYIRHRAGAGRARSQL